MEPAAARSPAAGPEEPQAPVKPVSGVAESKESDDGLVATGRGLEASSGFGSVTSSGGAIVLPVAVASDDAEPLHEETDDAAPALATAALAAVAAAASAARAGRTEEEESDESVAADSYDPDGDNKREASSAVGEVPAAEGVPGFDGRSGQIFLSPGPLVVCLGVLSVCVSLGVFLAHAARSSPP